jgi:hypothetical protein
MQTRIRTIKPEFYTHTSLFDLEQKSHMPIRVAFSGLWTVCDRDGRFKWDPRELKVHVLPYDDLDFAQVLDTLQAEGFIIRYDVGGRTYGYIPSWRNHQVLNPRERKSRLPSPDPAEELQNATPNLFSDLTREQTLHAGTGTGTGTERELNPPTPHASAATDVKTTDDQKIAAKVESKKPPVPIIFVHDDDNSIPQGLSEVEYARRFLGDVGLPEKGNVFVAADAIKALSKSQGLSLVSSFVHIRAKAFDDRDRGVAVDHLWILNGRYNQPSPRSKVDVATQQYADRFQTELAILRRSNGASA